ncbi:MAG: selenocysteine-specific translation elongation factor [Deltaproteobacteria bacterium]|nr:selenocysteine-specific translation elongation factor [Deltaproteobacteria bacterium]
MVGTAGHVDHGKTTLVRDLTGIDTDRLGEERARGISIQLGFAWLDLPAGRVALVDVPGHERFVREMIAGAAGLDLVLLVVAADEGVMPQTREHLDICELLGVRAGAVVLTKVDLVDEDWLMLVTEDVAEAVRGTFLEGAPVLRHASGDPSGPEAVRAFLGEALATPRGERSADRPFKMSLDRVFTMRGFGTVVTGTTASGTLSAGDAVVVLPGGATGRVRGVQVHHASVGTVGPGERAAVNLQGIDHGRVGRGEVLTHPGALEVASMFYASVTVPRGPGVALADGARVLVHAGTAQVEGTVALIGREELPAGESAPAQIRLDGPMAILPGEPFVARGFAALPGHGHTVAGGRLWTPATRRHRRRHTHEDAALIAALAGSDAEAMVEALVAHAALVGVPVGALTRRLPLTRAAASDAVQTLGERGRVVLAGEILLHRDTLDRLAREAVAALEEHHRARPALAGLSTEELRTRLHHGLAPELAQVLVSRLEADGQVVRRGDALAMAGFTPRLDEHQSAACQAVAAALSQGGLSPPRVQDLPELTGLSAAAVQEALDLLLLDGGVVRVSRELFYDAGQLSELEARLVAHLREHGTIDTGAFKELTGTSRKWTIPLGEYFDRVRVTLRVGDLRRLRASVDPG